MKRCSENFSLINWVGLTTLISREVRRFIKIWAQSLLPPIITSLLYILIFGHFLGSSIQEILPGVSYIDFMIPGLLMMNVISGAFSNTSASIYIGKFQNSIQELLVAPFSYVEMVLGYIIASTLRGVLVGLGVYIIAIFFTSATILHFWFFLFFILATSILFSCLGAIVGLWGQTFDHINLPQTFILLPLSFFGGVFHSIRLLPDWVQTLSRVNPVFYMVNGIRASMIGSADVGILQAAIVVSILAIIAFILCVYLFRSGYNLRS